MRKIVFSYSFIFVAFGFVVTGHFVDFLVFFSIIFFHELGHVFVAWLFGVGVDEVVFYPYGGVTKLNYLLNISLYKEFFIALGGFLFQFLYFFVFSFLFRVGFVREYVYLLFYKYHFSIFVFNVLPIIPLDGFRILGVIINCFFGYYLSCYISVFVSFVCVVLVLFFYGGIDYSFVLILFVLFNYIYEYLFSIRYFYNKFLLERFLYNIYFRGRKIIRGKYGFYRDRCHFIRLDRGILSERDFLNIIFRGK